MVLGTEPGKALRVAIPFVIGVLLLGFHIAFADSASWRSSLYPEDWEPDMPCRRPIPTISPLPDIRVARILKGMLWRVFL